jgi:HK97 family phage major capsid protein
MPVYNSIISDADIASLNTPETSNIFLQDVIGDQGSVALRRFQRIPMGGATTSLPVLSALPTAYWVNGPTGLKQTTEAAWSGRTIAVQELAALVPVPDSTLEDADFDVLAAVRPLVANAIAQKFDAAVYFGTDLPTGWTGPVGGLAGAAPASNKVPIGTTPANGGIAEDINKVFAAVEADGFDVNAILAKRDVRSLLRSARDTTGQKLLDVSTNSIEGIAIDFALRGLWPGGALAPRLVAGDNTQGAVAVRRDITFEVDSRAVINDAAGAVIYNAFQQDLTILRVTFRGGFVVANTMTPESATDVDATRWPWAVLHNAT